jgi:hypothetical protein
LSSLPSERTDSYVSGNKRFTIYQKISAEDITPPIEQCQPGFHWDANLLKCVADNPPPPPSTGNDKFGVKMLYPTKPNGETWYLNLSKMLNNQDPQVIYSSSMKVTDLKDNNDFASFKVVKSSDQENRFNITPSTGYDHSKCVTNWNTLLQRGYMQAPNDWRNVEITAHVKINSVFQESGHSLVWYARGGHHSTSYPCEASSYKGNIQYKGTSRFQKESGHPNYAYTNSKNVTGLTGSQYGRWFGFKFCLYDIIIPGETPDKNIPGVKLENWVDLNLNNNWVKVDEKTDYVGLNWVSPDSSNCGGAKDQAFLWGGPQAVFRFDSTKDIDFAKMSIREIQVSQ